MIGFGAAAFFLVDIAYRGISCPPIGQRQGRDVGQCVSLDEKCTIWTFLIRRNSIIGPKITLFRCEEVTFYMFSDIHSEARPRGMIQLPT